MPFELTEEAEPTGSMFTLTEEAPAEVVPTPEPFESENMLTPGVEEVSPVERVATSIPDKLKYAFEATRTAFFQDPLDVITGQTFLPQTPEETLALTRGPARVAKTFVAEPLRGLALTGIQGLVPGVPSLGNMADVAERFIGENKFSNAVGKMSDRLRSGFEWEQALDRDYEERREALLREGKWGQAAYQSVTEGGLDIAVGFLQLFMLQGIVPGMKALPGAAGKGAKGFREVVKLTAQNAGRHAIRAYLTTPGTAEEKFKAGATLFAFYMTPAGAGPLAGKIPNKTLARISAKALDFGANTALSTFMTRSYPNAIEEAKAIAESRGEANWFKYMLSTEASTTLISDIASTLGTEPTGLKASLPTPIKPPPISARDVTKVPVEAAKAVDEAYKRAGIIEVPPEFKALQKKTGLTPQELTVKAAETETRAGIFTRAGEIGEHLAKHGRIGLHPQPLSAVAFQFRAEEFQGGKVLTTRLGKVRPPETASPSDLGRYQKEMWDEARKSKASKRDMDLITGRLQSIGRAILRGEHPEAAGPVTPQPTQEPTRPGEIDIDAQETIRAGQRIGSELGRIPSDRDQAPYLGELEPPPASIREYELTTAVERGQAVVDPKDAEAQRNLGVSGDEHRGQVADRAKKVQGPEPISKRVVEGADKTAIAMADFYDNKAMEDAYVRSRQSKFDVNIAEMVVPNAFEVGGMIETRLGEKGVYASFDRLKRNRQYQEKNDIKLMDELDKADSSPTDLKSLPARLWGDVKNYLKGDRTVVLEPHWKKVGDGLLGWDDQTGKQMVKVNRVKRYVSWGETKGYTKDQEALLKPMVEVYAKALARNDLQSWEDHVARFVATKESDALVQKNYAPSEDGKQGDADDATILGRSVWEHFREDTTIANMSMRELMSKRKAKDAGEVTQNPLLALYRHHRKQSRIFYMRDVFNELEAKLYTGKHKNGTFANRRSEDSGEAQGLLGKKTQQYFRKWFEHLAGYQNPPSIWGKTLIRARANNFKRYALGISIKQPFQRFLGGVNNPKYVKAYEFGTRKTVENNVARELVKLFGQKEGARLTEQAQNEVMLGRQMMKQYFGEGVERVSFKDATLTQRLMLWPVAKMTDNQVIDMLNKMPLLGGDFWAERNMNFDANNRMTNMIEWMRKGQDLLIKQNLPYDKARKGLAFNRFHPHEERIIVDMLAKGQKTDAVFEIAKTHARIGNYMYDSKLRSLAEADPMARHLFQYATWWRGFQSRWARDLRSAFGKDWFTPDRTTQKINAAKSMTFLVLSGAISKTIYNYLSGKTRRDEEDFDGIWRNMMTYFHVGRYVPSGPGDLNTLAAPYHMIGQFLEEGTAPTQMFGWLYEYGKTIYKSGSDAIEAIDMINRGRETGNIKLYQRGQRLHHKNFRRATRFADDVFAQYYVGYQQATRMIDSVDGTQNADMVTKAIEKVWDETGTRPSWYQGYQPMQANRSLYKKIINSILGTNQPSEEELETLRLAAPSQAGPLGI